MGFLMRAFYVIACMLLLTGCKTGVFLTRPLETRPQEWSQQSCDASRSNRCASGISVPLHAAWSASLSETPIAASPIVVDNVIMVAGARGTIDCYNLVTGKSEGHIGLGSTLVCTPAAMNGMLCVAPAHPEVNAGIVNLKENRIERYLDASWIEAPPLAFPGRFVLASMDGRVSCFQADSGCFPVWTSRFPTRFYAAPSLIDSLVIVAGANGDVYALSAASGVQSWRVPTFSPITAAPLCVNGNVIVVNRAGAVLALDARNGRKAWSRVLSGMIHCTPAADDKRLYVAAADGTIHSLSLNDGKELWSSKPGGPVPGAPVVAGIHIVGATNDGTLFVLDGVTGAVLWRTEIDARIVSGPVVQNGYVAVCTDEGSLLVYRPGGDK
jgi:outer membrane protein assembly factor BamB